MKLLTPFLLLAAALPGLAQAPQTKTTGVLVALTVKPELRERAQALLPEEIRATVRLYLDGKIREWYSRGDGRGVFFILDVKDPDEARSILSGLPLAKEKLADLEFTPLAPLAPLGLLLGK
jgi:hypothetical protein